MKYYLWSRSIYEIVQCIILIEFEIRNSFKKEHTFWNDERCCCSSRGIERDGLDFMALLLKSGKDP